MASIRKSRNASKRLGKPREDSPEKDVGNGNRGNARKRKLSDMLGCQWSKDELEDFYEAYRKYGKNWKKVAGAIRNRSLQMVEALYNMNKAYLSLPDGMATAAGLIAMMTDHSNMLDGSDSDHESDGLKTSIKPQKRGRGKLRANSSKGITGRYPDLLQFQSSGYEFPVPKKKSVFVGGHPRVVGKRTPRFPVSYISDKNDRNKSVLPKRQCFKVGRDSGSDDEGAHVAALALAEACHHGGSPQVSQTPGSKTDIHSTERKIDEDCAEGSLGSREAENEDFIKDINHSLISGCSGTHTVKPKMRMLEGKKPKGEAENQNDDAREACSGTEEGIAARSLKEEVEKDLADQKKAYSNTSRKRNRQLFFGDENTTFDALQTLADLSLNMLLPSSTVESESSAQIKEEKRCLDAEKPVPGEKILKNGKRDRTRTLKTEEKGQILGGGVDVKPKNSKHRKSSALDSNASSEGKQEGSMPVKIQTRKRKASKDELPMEPCSDKSPKIKPLVEEEKKAAPKTKRPSQFLSPSKQLKYAKPPEYSSSTTDVGRANAEAIEMSPQVYNDVSLPVKRNRRKMNLYNAMAPKEAKSSEGAGENHLDKNAASDWIMDLKDKLSHCLTSPLLRRWCMFEWFYSAIDYPWYAKSEYVEYLTHVGLAHIPRLTRVEWGVIRSSLGKPRRFSQQLIQEEREKLEEYRESVRMHYIELRAGIREGLPTDLARPLSVGQRVIACHPKTREIHDGSVLTVDRNRCRVQFDRPELGVEFVMDIDCMPLDPLENMPDALRKRNLVTNKFFDRFSEMKSCDHLKEWKKGGFNSSNEKLETTNGFGHFYAPDYPMHTLIKHAKEDTIDGTVQAKAAANEVAVATRHAMFSQPCTLAQIQAKEDDIRALAELTRALDKKEALLIELRHMNEEVSLEQKEGESIKDIENFRKQYAMVLLQLRDANDLVAAALVFLRNRNTYVGNSMSPQAGLVENSTEAVLPCCPYNGSSVPSRDSGSHIIGIVDTSRRKAKSMVDVAAQAMFSLKEGEDVFVKVGEALDSLRKCRSGTDFGTLAEKSFHNSEPAHANLTSQEPVTSCAPETTAAPDAADVKSNKTSIGDESQFPSELISSCVSTLLMIQRCTERQYPPAEVAHILDSAVTSLLPCCSQNLPIYREIEACMGIIKNQMLALIPSPTSILPAENPIV